jgi:hypothetical protein
LLIRYVGIVDRGARWARPRRRGGGCRLERGNGFPERLLAHPDPCRVPFLLGSHQCGSGTGHDASGVQLVSQGTSGDERL